MANLKLTAATTVTNLQDISINPNASAVATAREGGFVLRNRINFSSVNSSAANPMSAISTAAATAKLMGVLEVPDGTTIRALSFHGVPGSSAVAHAWAYTSSVSSAGASTAKSAKLEIGVAAYKSASHSSLKTDTDAFHASIAITQKTGVIGSTFGAAVGSTPYAMAINHTTSNALEAVTFPYGGYVTFNYKAGSSAVQSYSASSAITGGALTGVMEARALADKMPE